MQLVNPTYQLFIGYNANIGTPEAIYAIRSLWFIYGDCYAATSRTCERIKIALSNGINALYRIEFSETKELGRVNRVDTLGITYLRIRGMWGISHPSVVIDYLSEVKYWDSFSSNAVMKESKYYSFPKGDREVLESLDKANLSLSSVDIKDPNNPARLEPAILINYWE